MRPVERGLAPRVYNAYGDAIGDLEQRLGNYCSYCERRLPVSLAVEHMSPKDIHPDLKLVWDNFLLACVTCNSVKGKNDPAAGTLWPDRDNTLLALTYSEGGFVRIAPGLDTSQHNSARALIDLVGLDRHDARGWPRPSPRDQRWQQREEIWTTALECLRIFKRLECSPDAMTLVVDVAKGYGFFSVWMTVFDGHPEVRIALIEALPGSAKNCFDDSGAALSRPGGVI
jgi:uncharacterized protein (TIGR02646 family)